MKRPSNMVRDNLRRDLASLKQRLEQARVIADGVGSAFWRSVRWMIERKMRECQEVLLSEKKHDVLSDNQRTILTTRWGDCTLFCSMVEDFAKGLSALESEYETKMEQFKDYDRKLRDRFRS